MRLIITKRTFITVIAALGLIVAPSVLGMSAASAHGMNGDDSYVALGDSVAAGLGLLPSPGATAEDTACGRSPQAYSSIVAAGLRHKPTVTNVACQGAVVANLSNPQTVGSTSVQPQLDAAFSNGTPDLMTMTMGANDVHWATFIGSCFATTCDTDANTIAANTYLASLKTNLKSALSDIQSRSRGHAPDVVLTGYYHPVSAQCVSSSLTASEVTWLNGETDALNNTIKEATQGYRFARFAPVDFTGHDICAADPWLQRPGVAGEPAAFHPNAKGQQAMATAVLQTLRCNHDD